MPRMTTGITGTELKVGDMVLFHRRLATVTVVSSNGKEAWGLEHTDGGGRTREFKAFSSAPIVYFPTLLDAIAAAGDFPKDVFDERALQAERWFLRPQIGDVLCAPGKHYFVEITGRHRHKVHTEIRSSTPFDRAHNLVWRVKYRSFKSPKAFRKAFERGGAPGYTVFAWSSKRPKDADRIETPGSVGEVK